jgi:hypothetical protein
MVETTVKTKIEKRVTPLLKSLLRAAGSVLEELKIATQENSNALALMCALVGPENVDGVFVTLQEEKSLDEIISENKVRRELFDIQNNPEKYRDRVSGLETDIDRLQAENEELRNSRVQSASSPQLPRASPKSAKASISVTGRLNKKVTRLHLAIIRFVGKHEDQGINATEPGVYEEVIRFRGIDLEAEHKANPRYRHPAAPRIPELCTPHVYGHTLLERVKIDGIMTCRLTEVGRKVYEANREPSQAHVEAFDPLQSPSRRSLC